MPDVIFNGPDGRLEGRYSHNRAPNAPVAIILHPHPEHGGTMNNRIVYALYHAFVRRHFSVLRFNFRGVGRSQGTFDRGEGELSDAASALDWLQGINQNASACWVAAPPDEPAELAPVFALPVRGRAARRRARSISSRWRRASSLSLSRVSSIWRWRCGARARCTCA
jgi:hypothetical protein